MEPRFFVDMDGVLTDFDGQFKAWFGFAVKVALYKSDPETKRIIDVHLTDAKAEFWADMPWLPGAQDFWRENHGLSPILLSSPHRAIACVPGKLTWIQSNLGSDVPAILDTDKARHGRAGDILLDDTPENARGWPGRFILHETWERTHGQLNSLFNLP